ncbi:IS5 family transposase [Deinococcus enclensis]|uniref:Transposase n=1 Tax=Deinococcus enclensis TaxID=1049582 RepID=A0ABT9MFJ2_9DEIO|nr:IS5 family transposase [Deinococcus enclensis]MDP9765365.1 transposase [Deinococcus enclensis]
MSALHRHDLTDEQWNAFQPHLPQARGFGGRPRLDDRTFLNAVLWLLRTGAPWRDLPPVYGNWSSVATRFYRWSRQGVWQHVLECLQQLAHGRGHIDWETQFIDSTVIRTHHHAAGAQGGQQHEALGRSRGGFSTKLHVKCEGGGKPLAVFLTGGEHHEMLGLVPLLNAGRVKRGGPGRPKSRPKQLVGDRGYSNGVARKELRRRGIRAVIPPKRNQRRQHGYDRAVYRERNRVERAIVKLKRFRRVATRYDKRQEVFLALVTLAIALEWV